MTTSTIDNNNYINYKNITYSNSNNTVHVIDPVTNKPIDYAEVKTVSNNDNTYVFDNNNMYAIVEVDPIKQTTLGLDNIVSAGLKQVVNYLHVKDEMQALGLPFNPSRQWNNKDQQSYFYWSSGLNLFSTKKTEGLEVKNNSGFAYSQEMPINIANEVAPYAIVYFKETKTPRTQVGDLINVSFIVYEINNIADSLLLSKNDGSVDIPIITNVEFTLPFIVGTYNLTVKPRLNDIQRAPFPLLLNVVNPIDNSYSVLPIWKFNNIFANQITSGIVVEKNGTATTFLWDFGDGSTEVTTTNLKRFTHTYDKPGTYILSVTATIDLVKQPISYAENVIIVNEDLGVYNLVPLWEFFGTVGVPTTGEGYSINGKPDQVILDFGDGSPVQVITDYSDTEMYYHTYTKAGIYEVSMIAILDGITYPKEINYPYTVITDTSTVPYSLLCDWVPTSVNLGTYILGTVSEFGTSGRASNLIVDYGDGTTSQIFDYSWVTKPIKYKYSKAGTYVITITPTVNNVIQSLVTCSTITVADIPKPINVYSIAPSLSLTDAYVNTFITCIVTETNGKASNFLWDFKDGTEPINFNADAVMRYAYTKPGTYLPTVQPTINNVLLPPFNCNANVTITINPTAYALNVVWEEEYAEINTQVLAAFNEKNGNAAKFIVTLNNDDPIVVNPLDAPPHNTLPVIFDKAGTYTAVVQAVDSNNVLLGTSTTDTLTVVNNKALANINGYKSVLVIPELNGIVKVLVTMSVVELTMKGASFFWDFGDGLTLTTTDLSVLHAYDTVGSYTVSVTPVYDELNMATITNLDLIHINEVLQKPVINNPNTFIYQDPVSAGTNAGNAAYASTISIEGNTTQGRIDGNAAAQAANFTATNSANAYNTAHNLTKPN